MQNFGGEIYGTYSIKIAENKSYSFLDTQIKAELNRIDYVFSTYKPTSEISLINKTLTGFGLTSLEIYLIYPMKSAILVKVHFHQMMQMVLISAIGKGYAIDKIAELMEKNGVNNYFIEIGGEIRAKGLKFSDEWIFGIERPTNSKKAPISRLMSPQKAFQ